VREQRALGVGQLAEAQLVDGEGHQALALEVRRAGKQAGPL
jgi:hypothetical protein